MILQNNKPFLCFFSLLLIFTLAPASASTLSSFSVPNSDFTTLANRIGAIEPTSRTLDQTFQLAVASWRLGRLKAAQTLTDQLIKADFALGDSLYLKGLIHLTEVREVNVFKKIGTAKKALKAWEQAIKADPNHILALFAVTAFYVNAPSFAGGDLDAAKARLPEILALDPDYHQLAAGLIAEKEDQPDRAEQLLGEARTDGPDQVIMLFQLGQFYYRAEDYERAAQTFERLQDYPLRWHHPVPSMINLMRGMALKKQGDLQASRAVLETVRDGAQNSGLKAWAEKELAAF
jgi:tetratricopeptide (TPR) repeat protein